jgi:hypothetical protein
MMLLSARMMLLSARMMLMSARVMLTSEEVAQLPVAPERQRRLLLSAQWLEPATTLGISSL